MFVFPLEVYFFCDGQEQTDGTKTNCLPRKRGHNCQVNIFWQIPVNELYDGGCSIMIDSDDEAGWCSIIIDSDGEAGGCSDVSAISSNSVRTFGARYRLLSHLGHCVGADKQLPVVLQTVPPLQRSIIKKTAEINPKIASPPDKLASRKWKKSIHVIFQKTKGIISKCVSYIVTTSNISSRTEITQFHEEL